VAGLSPLTGALSDGVVVQLPSQVLLLVGSTQT
jgi:hypothetical protein